MSPSSLDVMRLGLIGNARKAAELLAKDHPDVVFSSGRRTLTEQAHAMATNIVAAGGKWLLRTYKPSNVLAACARWVETHPEAKTVDAIAGGLATVFTAFDDRELAKISKHLTGQAFDVEPVPGLHGQMILMSLRSIVRELGGVLLEQEGGLVRWHAQF